MLIHSGEKNKYAQGNKTFSLAVVLKDSLADSLWQEATTMLSVQKIIE